MSVLGIRVPAAWEVRVLGKVVKTVANVNFTFLSFKKTANKSMKTAIIRLSEKVDPQLVIEKLEGRVLKESGQPMKAYIMDEIPDVEPYQDRPLTVRKKGKALKMNKRQPAKPAVGISHYELLIELQTKYNRLNKLSRTKTDNRLMEELSKIIFNRLADVSKSNPTVLKPFQLTSAYRRAHPHFGDFQCILSTLHQIEDEEGKPRTQLSESDLIDTTAPGTAVDKVPYEKVVEACNRYTEKITQKVQDHIAGLSCDYIDGLDPAKKRVRIELKKMLPYLPTMIRQVMSKHLIPQNIMSRKVRIYGEPFLPGQEVMRGVLRSFNPVAVNRVQSMYNLLQFSVSPAKLPELLKLDKSAAGPECKLIVRVSEEKPYVTPAHVLAELKRSL